MTNVAATAARLGVVCIYPTFRRWRAFTRGSCNYTADAVRTTEIGGSMHLQQVDLNLLVYLEALLEEQSVVKAAKRLNITQPALSNALRRLRETLDDELLVQTGRAMRPTRFAESIRDPLKHSLRILQDQVVTSRNFDPAQDSFEFVTAFHGYEERILMPALTQACAAFPKIAIHNRQPKSIDSGEELAAGTIHFTTSPITSSRAGIMRCKLLSDEYVCVVNNAANTSEISIDQFCALPHILIAPHGGKGAVDRALDGMKLTRCVRATVGEFNNAPHVLSAHKELITTVPRRLAQIWCRQFPFKTIACPVQIEPLVIFLSWHTSLHSSPELSWFKELCMQASQAPY